MAEPAYDTALGEPWTEDRAGYLALLAEEENTGTLADGERPDTERIPFPVRKRWWWRG